MKKPEKRRRLTLSVCGIGVLALLVMFLIKEAGVNGTGDSNPPSSSAPAVSEAILSSENSGSSAESSGTSCLAEIASLPAETSVDADEIDFSRPEQYFTAAEIVQGDPVFERISGKSYRENDDIALSDLRYLKVLHYDFSGKIRVGELIVNAGLSDEFLSIFRELFLKKYQICSMYLVDNFWAGNAMDTDTASIEADNTSAFNYRKSTSSSNLSKHALGCAIDINPLENPYVTYTDGGAASAEHENAQKYVENRSKDELHVITAEDPAYRILVNEHGFTWGGNWTNPRDYQHFEKELS